MSFSPWLYRQAWDDAHETMHKERRFRKRTSYKGHSFTLDHLPALKERHPTMPFELPVDARWARHQPWWEHAVDSSLAYGDRLREGSHAMTSDVAPKLKQMLETEGCAWPLPLTSRLSRLASGLWPLVSDL